ncbi:uncharacterized protein L201_005880 [Kwoniella dendrophila CBS 6074]|uniref:DUF218 domain-containing protein n=1 Tax=Kwoniella dendrophila CBS 6074 TaxID=1295534 RepID=A0AAX4K213_9TREE
MTTSQSTFIPRSEEVNSVLSAENVEDANTISAFLASPSYPFDFTDPDDTVYVLIGSAILPTVKATLDHIAKCTDPATLVLAGGIGHSTSLLYQAVSQHPKYCSLSDRVEGLTEAKVFELLLLNFWPDLKDRIENGTLKLLIDDRSANCGANAIETKKELDKHGIQPKRLFIVQDPTMHRRTLATFKKVFEHEKVELLPWSFFPKLSLDSNGTASWDISSQIVGGIENYELWETSRFISLILGEIPRIRDDKNGYGPQGAGYIAHVDIPKDVEKAWTRLNTALQQRTT